MKKKIKINFVDFWGGFDPSDNYFTNLLKDDYDVEISNTPDYLFYSVFGLIHLERRYDECVKIMYIGENISPSYRKDKGNLTLYNDFDKLVDMIKKGDKPIEGCDYSLSFDPINDVNYRIPHYLLYPGYYDLVNKKTDENLLNRKFCSFVVSNGGSIDRNNFFIKLSKYKKIDSAGRHFNNTGYLANNKIDFIKDYKFNICFENDAYRGYNEFYTTEKLMESCVANTIGIYKGNTKIENEFNVKSFINVSDFKNFDDAIEYIIYLDKNDDKYMEVMKQPWFIDNKIPETNKVENIKKFLKNIFG